MPSPGPCVFSLDVGTQDLIGRRTYIPFGFGRVFYYGEPVRSSSGTEVYLWADNCQVPYADN